MISAASSTSPGVAAPNDVPRASAARHRGDDRRVRVPEDHRPPGADQVNVLPAVHVEQVRPAAPLDEPGHAAHRAERADRGVHAARGHLKRRGRTVRRSGRSWLLPSSSQASTRNSSRRSPSGSGCPAGCRTQRTSWPVAVPGRRGEHVSCPGSASAATSVWADVSGEASRPQDHHSSSSRARPWSPRRTASGRRPAPRPARSSTPAAAIRGERRRPVHRGHVKNIKNPPGDEYHIRLRTGFPPLS